MTNQTKKILLFAFLLVVVLVIVLLTFLPASTKKGLFEKTVPFLGSKPNPSFTPAPVLPKGTPAVPRQTNVDNILSQGSPAQSQTEIEKVKPDLPIRVDNFETSLKQKTSLNIFTLPSDPKSLLHIEIYGINYNHPEINQSDAIAFKESFLLAKKALTTRNINIKNLQLIYGNRQYIQDTATYWITTLKLLD